MAILATVADNHYEAHIDSDGGCGHLPSPLYPIRATPFRSPQMPMTSCTCHSLAQLAKLRGEFQTYKADVEQRMAANLHEFNQELTKRLGEISAGAATKYLRARVCSGLRGGTCGHKRVVCGDHASRSAGRYMKERQAANLSALTLHTDRAARQPGRRAHGGMGE